MKNTRIITVACICLTAGIAVADDARKEDLSACKLPHGELVIPDRNTPEGRSGYILRLSDGTLNPSPFKTGEKPKSAGDFLARIVADKVGDLMYSSLNDGTLIAVSGRAADLGEKFLYELSGASLERPQPAQSKKERSASGEGTPGAVDSVQDGHCYLVETADGKYALVRLVQKRGRLALIQFVYQPSGKMEFDIPKSDITKVQTATATPASIVPTSPITVPGNVTDIKSLLAIREQMIAKVIAIVKEPAKTQQEIMAKSDAILALGRLRASEAAPILIQDIDFRNSFVLSREASIANRYPAVGALIEIGIPGAKAALGQIGSDTAVVMQNDAARERIDLRRDMLALVILKVYGERLAKIVVEDKIAAAAEPKLKESLQKTIEAFPRVGNWLPEEETATTMPAAAMPAK